MSVHPAAARHRALLAASLRATATHPLASVSLALIALVTAAGVLLTAGNSLATETTVIRSFDETGSRVVVAYDPDEAAGIRPSSVETVGRTDAAVWVFGLGAALDYEVAGSAGSGPVAVRMVLGDVAGALTVTSGRMPRPGEAILGERAARTAGLLDGVGGLTRGADEIAVVGVFSAAGPLDRLGDVALAVPSDDAASNLRYLYALAPEIGEVDRLADALRASAVAANPDRIQVDEPKAAIALQQLIAGQLGTASRQAMALILTVSGLLVLTVVTMVVGSRRRDVGRWRALGATRSAVVVGFLVQVALPVMTGSLVGVLGAQLWNAQVHGFTNSWTFAAALMVDILIASLLAAVVPAVLAAQRDPVRVLRVP